MTAFLFDFNGTLFNDAEYHKIAWGRYLYERCGIRLTEEEILKKCIGPNNQAIIRTFFGADTSTEMIERCGEEKEEMYRRIVREKPERMKLVDGVAEALDLLCDKGIPFALATASPLSNVEFYLHELGLEKWFDMSRVLYEDGNQEGKPDPAFYSAAAKLIGLSPAECTVVEDTPTGIQGAINAGAGRIIAILNTNTRERLSVFPQISAFIENFIGFERFI